MVGEGEIGGGYDLQEWRWKGKLYIVLNIIPEPFDDTDEWYHLFVKYFYNMGLDGYKGNDPEPSSYNQEGRGLEYHYPYIHRIKVSGEVVAMIWRNFLS